MKEINSAKCSNVSGGAIPSYQTTLPDIDFNIFAGNALVGYATLDEVRQAIQFAGDGQARLPLYRGQGF